MRRVCLAFLLSILLASAAAAEKREEFVVGVSQFKPLVFEENGKLTGFDIELWEAIASELELKYQFRKVPFQELLELIKKKEVDIGIAGISITAEREQYIDFTHHYLNSGLSTLVLTKTTAGIITAIKTLANRAILWIFLSFLGFTIVCGHILWLSERGADAIDDNYFPGIFEAFWCTLATATTVGYGDVVPKKFLGRLAAFFVMIAGIGFFGILSAELMSALTTLRLDSDIETSKDLHQKTIATVTGTTSVNALREVHAYITEVDEIEKAYQLLLDEKVEAVVYDSPVLMHYSQNEGAGEVFITGGIFDLQYYGIALTQDNEFREDINRALLEFRKNGTYDKLYRKWFGQSSTES